MTNIPWTSDQVQELIRLTERGFTSSEIASEMGVTRCSVAGQWFRRGMKSKHPRPEKRSKPSSLKSSSRASREREIADRTTNSSIRSALVARAIAMGELPSDEPVTLQCEPVGPVVSLMNLRDHHCRWPVSDKSDRVIGYCGSSRYSAFPYCPRHCLAAYRYRSATRGEV